MFQVTSKNGFKDLIYIGNTIPAGNLLYRLTGEIINKPTRTSIQIGSNEHIIDNLGQYINHSCDPSVKVIGCDLISVKEIKNGDSITFDYNHTEDCMSNPFYCNCCGKIICGRLVYTIMI